MAYTEVFREAVAYSLLVFAKKPSYSRPSMRKLLSTSTMVVMSLCGNLLHMKSLKGGSMCGSLKNFLGSGKVTTATNCNFLTSYTLQIKVNVTYSAHVSLKLIKLVSKTA